MAKRVSERRLWAEHEKMVAAHGGDFVNRGWVSGGTFVYSKTTVGRLLSQVAGARVEHWWAPGGGRGFSANITLPVHASLPAKKGGR